MKLFGHELVGTAKTLVILAAVFLVSSGLCGLQMIVANHSMGGDGTWIIPMGLAELAAMLLSAGGIVLVLIAWGVRAIYDRFTGAQKSGVQKLLNENDDTWRDEER